MVGAWRSRRREVTILLPRPSRISGRLGRLWDRPKRVTDAFRDMLDPASRREDTRRDG